MMMKSSHSSIKKGEKFYFNDFFLNITDDFADKNFTKINDLFKKLKGSYYSIKSINEIKNEIDKIALQKEFVFINAKYNESIAEYSSATGDEVQNFRAVKIPRKVNDIILSDWRDFVKISNMPASWYLTGFGPTADGKIIQKNERAYREFIRDLCSNDLDVFRRVY